MQDSKQGCIHKDMTKQGKLKSEWMRTWLTMWFAIRWFFTTNLILCFWNFARHAATCNYINFKIGFKHTTVTCNITLHQSKKWEQQFYLAANGKPTSNHLTEPSTTSKHCTSSSLTCYYDQMSRAFLGYHIEFQERLKMPLTVLKHLHWFQR